MLTDVVDVVEHGIESQRVGGHSLEQKHCCQKAGGQAEQSAIESIA